MKKIQLLLFVLLMGCQELLTVPNISYEKVVFLQPKNDTTFNSPDVQFRWEQIENASHYRFQLIHLEDTSSQRLLRDTLLDTNQFRDSLEINGRYWWRVKAENSGYSTSYTEGEFNVNTPHITNYEITLISPPSTSDITELTPLFSWDGPLEIEQYRFQLAQPDFDSAFHLLVDTLTMNKNLRVPLAESGAYAWRVRGENQDGNSAFKQNIFNLINPLLEQEVNLIYPVEEAVLSNLTTRFEWDTLAHANHYRFQIAAPDFISAEQILLDSLVSENTITTTLSNEKQFQWRVRGENTLGATSYSSRSFTRNDPLEQWMISLSFPQGEQRLTNLNVFFQWEAAPLAENYQIQIVRPNFNTIEEFVLDSIVEQNNFQTTLEDNQQYSWSVRGLSTTASTAFSSSTFNIATQNDLTNQQLLFLAPANNSVLSTTNVNFNWEALTDVDYYHIQIATPSFNNALQILVDQETALPNITASLSSSATYEWRVRAHNSHSRTNYTSANFTIK